MGKTLGYAAGCVSELLVFTTVLFYNRADFVIDWQVMSPNLQAGTDRASAYIRAAIPSLVWHHVHAFASA